jgi:predicted O-methyltransferase YrrM
MKPARRLAYGLATILGPLIGLDPKGFFIPYKHARSLPRAGTNEYPSIEALLAERRPAFRQVLAAIQSHGAALAAIGGNAPPQPRWNQDWFSGLDAAAAYALVRERRPRSVVEVGSGHSTRFIARAIADGGLPASLTAIDPEPRAALAGLKLEAVRKTAQEADPALFAGLRAGDMLFIDSSHVLMPGSDVDFLFNRVLPGLAPGTLVHVHDIFLPDDYPPEWAWRGYNEQNAVGALLQGGAWRPLFASHYVSTRMRKETAGPALAGLPIPPTARTSSLWIEKQGQ